MSWAGLCRRLWGYMKSRPRYVRTTVSPIPHILHTQFLSFSRAAVAKQLISSGGLYLNNVPVRDLARRVMPEDLIDGRIFIIRTGKDNHRIFVIDPHLETAEVAKKEEQFGLRDPHTS